MSVLAHKRWHFWLGVGLVLAAALSWSTAGLFTRMVHTDVFTTLFWRSLLGGASVCGAYAVWTWPTERARHLFRLSLAEWGLSVVTACAMVTFIASFFYASVADVVFIYGAFPISTLLLSALLLRTAIRWVDAVCASVVACGVVVILWGQTSWSSAFGTLLSLLATLLFALMTIGAQRYPLANMVKVTYVGALGVSLVVLPFVDWQHSSYADLAWLWLFGVVNLGIGFGLYLLGVRYIKTVLAALICMVEIPLSPLWTYWLLGETVKPQSLWGGAVIVFAVIANLVFTPKPKQKQKSKH
jgi:drug/metabolite transporter (DMT)-like permease